MAQIYELALLSASAYQQNRSARNRVFPPSDWQPISLALYPDGHAYDSGSGFEAVAYRKGNEIVIAFTGTDEKWDWWTNLATGTGVTAPAQVEKAAEFYAMVAGQYGGAGIDISFTGHSLGGGLAGLMGVMFNKVAWTFDPAPFRQSANNDTRNTLVSYLERTGFGSTTAIRELSEFHSSQASSMPSDVPGIRGEENIYSMLVQNEALNKWLGFSSLFIGFPVNAPVRLTHGSLDQSAVDLHDISLLAAMQTVERFYYETVVLPKLIPTIYDADLFDKDRGVDRPVLLDHLLRGQTVAVTPADGMLTHFATDLAKIVSAGGQAVADNDLNRALIAFAGRAYLKQSSGFEKELFKKLDGGVGFDTGDVTSDMAADPGYGRHLEKYLERQLGIDGYAALRERILQSPEWYLAGAGMVAQAKDRASFMLGSESGDNLTGGMVADLLIGSGGNDVLQGGKANDHLDGGTGFDTYVWNTNDGADRIIDADRNGRILINGSAAKLLVQKTATTWISHDGKLTLTQPEDSSGGWKLDIAGGGSLDLGSSFNDGDYGLYRQDAAPVLPTNPTIVGDRSPKEFTANFTGTIDYNKFGPGWYITQITVTAEHADPEDATKSIVDAYKVTYNTKDALGNYVTEGDGSAPNRNDTLNGDATQADYIQAFGGNDEIDAKGGNDRIQAGAGDDLVDAGAGHDLVEGGSGADRLLGGDGRDTLWGDSAASGSTPIASAIAGGETDSSQNSKGDWLDGGTGDDILIGGTANDVLVAGAENDLLVGGAGDDLLLGDGIGQINPAASWSTGRQVSTDPDTKITSYTATFSGSSATWFSQFGGADMLYGGAGDDWVFAGTGDDQVDGGKGQDVLFGEAGNDVVLGGLDDDLIIGDSSGLAENLQGHDWLDGGEGKDTLEGMGGDDVLIGGRGDDTLMGGKGRDTYLLNKGDYQIAECLNVQKSRRWRYGDSIESAGNEINWRHAA